MADNLKDNLNSRSIIWEPYYEQDSPFYVPHKPKDYYENTWPVSNRKEDEKDQNSENLEAMISSIKPPWIKKEEKKEQQKKSKSFLGSYYPNYYK